MTYNLPTGRRRLVHKPVELRNLSKKMQAAVDPLDPEQYALELKYDGCHMIVVKQDGKAYAFSREGNEVQSCTISCARSSSIRLITSSSSAKPGMPASSSARSAATSDVSPRRLTCGMSSSTVCHWPTSSAVNATSDTRRAAGIWKVPSLASIRNPV